MSEENVEIVRAVIEAWNSRNMDGLRELYDPDVIMRMPEGWPEPGPHVGREAVMRHWEQQREALDADVMEPISIIDAADRVVLRHFWRGVGHGPEVNFKVTNIFTVRMRRRKETPCPDPSSSLRQTGSRRASSRRSESAFRGSVTLSRRTSRD